MEGTNEINSNKKVFEDLENKGRTFEDDSNEFAGDDITVYLKLILVKFFN